MDAVEALLLTPWSNDSLRPMRLRLMWPVGRGAWLSLVVLAVCGGVSAFAQVGEVDPGFKPPQFDLAPLSAVVVTPDKRLLVAGRFRRAAGLERGGLARLYEDGSLDAGFSLRDGFRFSGNRLAAMRDGKCVLCVYRPRLLGEPIKKKQPDSDPFPIVRLNPDGSSDLAYAPAGSGQMYGTPAFATQIDGELIYSSSAVLEGLKRLREDGTQARDFRLSGEESRLRMSGIQIQQDGRILLGTDPVAPSGVFGMVRQMADGRSDPAFRAELTQRISRMVLGPDGRTYVFSQGFTTRNAHSVSKLVRLNHDGAVDPSFQAADAPGKFALQEDGKLVCAKPGRIGNTWGAQILRLNPDGSLDAAFPSKILPRIMVQDLVLQADGRIVVAGSYSVPTNALFPLILRMFNDPCVDELKVSDETKLRWVRGGSAPAVTQALFELSTDAGRTWTWLGRGIRKPDAWELEGLTLPATGIVRALGQTAGAESSGMVQQVRTYSLKP